MELIIVLVLLVIVYAVYNRFEASVDEIASIAERKAIDVNIGSKVKSAKFRSKALKKIEALGEIPSVDELNKLLDGE
jgi:hypothetical protein